MLKRQGAKPPEPGAVRVYPVVPVTEEDVVAVAIDRYARRGWKPIEQDYYVNVIGDYAQVALWAVPPRREAVAS